MGPAQDMLAMVQAILGLFNASDISNTYKVGGVVLAVV
jgi:hypothetical protein